MSFQDKLLEIVEMAILDEPMSRHTSFKVGGPARFFVNVESTAELVLVIALCKHEDMPYAIIGRGSNLLVSDEGFDGVVIHIGDALSRSFIDDTTITAAAGISLGSLAMKAYESGLTGLEFAAGIPGSLGGAVIMNAGAYGGEMKDVITSVTVVGPEGKPFEIPAEEMDFGYRSSRAAKEQLIVLSAKLQLAHGNKEEIKARMDELAAKRREKQPLEFPSAGSTFKRPEGNYAGALIEAAGLKGYSIGGAQVSEKHAGFVINKGGATAADIYSLCNYVREKVRESSGISLELEVKTLGKF